MPDNFNKKHKMENDSKQNYGQSNHNLQTDDQDKKNAEQAVYAEDIDSGQVVTKRIPNLVHSHLDDDNDDDDDLDDDLDDDENNE